MKASSKLAWEVRTGIVLALGVITMVLAGMGIYSGFNWRDLGILIIGVIMVGIALRWANNVRQFSKSYPIG